MQPGGPWWRLFIYTLFHNHRPACPVLVGPPELPEKRKKKKKETPKNQRNCHDPDRNPHQRKRNKGKTKEKVRSKGGPALPPILRGYALCSYAPNSCRAQEFQYCLCCPPVPQQSHRGSAWAFPLARLSYRFPQPPALWGPRLTPSEEMVPGLGLAAGHHQLSFVSDFPNRWR